MESELRDLISSNTWNQLYDCIRRESLGQDFSRLEASKPENRNLNRYRDVYPYDHSRVVLNDYPETDYINASLVKAPRANRKYILAQGPLPSTVGHFWLVVWQQKSRAVLMLNRVMEKGQLKCHQYWPVDQGDDMIFEDVGLRLENIGSVPGDHYTVRTLRLSKINNKSKNDDSEEDEEEKERDIYHFHYTTWPDFGVPQCPDTFLEFLTAVRESGSLDEDAGPPVVHCSAGIGRSGSFCLVDTCLVLVTKEGPESVCIRDVLLDLRNYRMGLIQTPDQLKFSYLAIAAGAHNAGLLSDKIWTEISESEISSSNDSDGSEGNNAPPPPLPPRSDSLRNEQQLILQQQQLILKGTSDNNGLQQQQQDENAESISQLLQSLGKNNTVTHVNGKSDHSPGSNDSSSECNIKDSAAVSDSVSNNSSKLDLAKTDSSSSSTRSPTSKCILNNHKMEERKREMEIRRRKKEAARSNTEQKIKEMKRKSKEAEEYQTRKGRFLETVVPFCVGLAMCAVGTYFYMKG